MAEERLIDDDKDRKYKIRVNEDGEEELIIAPQTAAEEAAEIDFEVPDFDDDDEEAAVMTPEQLAARQRRREEEAARRAQKNALKRRISAAQATRLTRRASWTMKTAKSTPSKSRRIQSAFPTGRLSTTVQRRPTDLRNTPRTS